MYKDYDNYRTYESDDLSAGGKLKIEHNISMDEKDMSDLISKPLEKIQAMREESVKKEIDAFEKTQQAARKWEKHAAVTRRLDRAIEYLKIPETKHTSNKWVKGKDEFDFTHISNKVYSMSYRIYERSSWRTRVNKYDVTWNIFTNNPRSNYNIKIAGQEKTCNSKEEAEKYIQGRIKAYSHLFTEISPTIPQEYSRPFKMYGQTLPGYTIEGEPQQEQENVKSDKKPSIRQELNSIKAAEKSAPKPTPTKKHDNPEL